VVYRDALTGQTKERGKEGSIQGVLRRKRGQREGRVSIRGIRMIRSAGRSGEKGKEQNTRARERGGDGGTV